MQSNATDFPFENIHFPQRLILIKNLRIVSFIINDIVLFVAVIIFIVWVSNFTGLKILLFEKLAIIPEASVIFFLACATLFFGARRHLNNKNDLRTEKYPWWNTFIPIYFAVITTVLGIISFIQISILGFQLHISSIGGLCVILLGLSLIPPYTRIPHRFHITQLFIFIISGVSMFVVLENIFQLIANVPVQQSIAIPLSLALTFAFFCFGILLRWSNRGFIGNFTLNSTGSTFALRIFVINLVAAPLVALVVLMVAPRIAYNMYQTISLLVIFLTFISSLLIWLNLKSLYKYEFEHLLMRETLRVHNIDLTENKKKLEEKMQQMEQDKQKYKEVIDVQEGWRDAVESSG